MSKQSMDMEDGSSPRKVSPPPPPSCLQWRYVVAVLGSMGMGIIYGLKVNLHISIVAMVNKTAVNMENSIQELNDTREKRSTDSNSGEDGPFIWNSAEQGLILSSYFIGYFITQVPGGRLAELWSGKLLFLIAVLVNAVGAILTPIACQSIPALLMVRIFQGLGGEIPAK